MKKYCPLAVIVVVILIGVAGWLRSLPKLGLATPVATMSQATPASVETMAPVADAPGAIAERRGRAPGAEAGGWQEIIYQPPPQKIVHGLNYAVGPANGPAKMLAWAKGVAHGNFGEIPPALIAAADADDLTVRPPLPICFMPINAIADGSGLEACQPSHFLYLVDGGGTPVLACEVDVSNVKWSISTNFLDGRNPNSRLAAALDHLQGMEEVQAGFYEPILLKALPTLAAIWLKPLTKGPDLVYVIDSGDTLEAGKLYAGSEFIAALAPIMQAKQAASRQNAFDPAGPGG